MGFTYYSHLLPREFSIHYYPLTERTSSEETFQLKTTARAYKLFLTGIHQTTLDSAREQRGTNADIQMILRSQY